MACASSNFAISTAIGSDSASTCPNDLPRIVQQELFMCCAASHPCVIWTSAGRTSDRITVDSQLGRGHFNFALTSRAFLEGYAGRRIVESDEAETKAS